MAAASRSPAATPRWFLRTEGGSRTHNPVRRADFESRPGAACGATTRKDEGEHRPIGDAEALNMATPMATKVGAELAALALGARLLVGLDAALEVALLA